MNEFRCSRGTVAMAGAVILALPAIGCSEATDAAGLDGTIATSPGTAVDLDAPAGPGAGEPNLFVDPHGGVLMSWLEPIATGNEDITGGAPASTRSGHFALRFSRLHGNSWSPPRTIAESDRFFVNWADFPSIIESGGVLAAHWLQKSAPDTFAYDVHISRSIDDGESWSESVVPHADGTHTEHGFVSMVPAPGGGFSAIWLDGRNSADRQEGDSPDMTLRATSFDASGAQGPEALLDERICDCCQTSAAYIGGNLVVAYRDRSEEEIRDIWSVRRTAQGWQEPVRVAHDNWQIPGCPVNGPAVAGGESIGAVAWFSLRGNVPEVKATFSRDGGASYGSPVLLDRGPAQDVERGDGVADDEAPGIPLGRVGIAWESPDRAVVSWLVSRGNVAEIILQTVDAEGRLGKRHTIAATSASRASGFPRLVRQGDRLVVAWTDVGETSTIRTATVALPLE